MAWHWSVLCPLESRKTQESQGMLQCFNTVLHQTVACLLQHTKVCLGNVNQHLSGSSGPCDEAVFSSLGLTLVWDSQCGTWVLQEGGRVRYGSAFLPFIIPSPPTPLPSKRNLHLRSRPDHILSLFAEETSHKRVWFCIPAFYHPISRFPPKNLPEKCLVFTASCDLPCHETTCSKFGDF